MRHRKSTSIVSLLMPEAENESLCQIHDIDIYAVEHSEKARKATVQSRRIEEPNKPERESPSQPSAHLQVVLVVILTSGHQAATKASIEVIHHSSRRFRRQFLTRTLYRAPRPAPRGPDTRNTNSSASRVRIGFDAAREDAKPIARGPHEW
ncbi:hypothetical protein OBBRIDRAFT_552250 [Obba rivulosa]|uniref:Uncharacterized protein n=1 Tax=Obba rivulosa TaxID=1052685 RepID=A0A8E2DL18_9APHY|nr:hypothetical protein OBBRIDRAFT_552250 [Obba rivulosa]